MSYNLNRALPGGWFFATDETSGGEIVATAMCLHNYSGASPFTGDVGWVFCRPEHRGKGLGFHLSAQVVRRFLEAGYRDIQLHTEYHRLAAIKTYLRLGFVPRIDAAEVASLWEQVCTNLDLPYEPAKWQEKWRKLDGDGESFGLAESVERRAIRLRYDIHGAKGRDEENEHGTDTRSGNSRSPGDQS